MASKKEREEVLENIYERAFTYEKKYGNCPQAVLATINDFFGIIDKEAFKGAFSLAGGGALCGDGTCGGLVGGIMAVSCKYGRSREEFGSDGTWLHAYKMAKRIHEKFVEEFGSPICHKVQEKIFGRSFDLWDPKDVKAFEEAGAHEDKCPAVTGKVARWTAELLLRNGVALKERK